MSAYMVVGPTNVKPSLRRALDRASDSDDFVGISATVCGAGVRSGRKDHTKSTRPPLSRSRRVARALVIAARILARLRTIRASAINRSTARSSYSATTSGTKSAHESWNAGRLSEIVDHENAAWKASKLMRSYMPRSSRTGMPHSVSLYARNNGSTDAHGVRVILSSPVTTHGAVVFSRGWTHEARTT